jgi:CheY-like chemotaxis protein
MSKADIEASVGGIAARAPFRQQSYRDAGTVTRDVLRPARLFENVRNAGESPMGDGTSRPTQQQETILIVEDDPLLLTFAAEELTSIGYRVLKASNAREALTHLQHNERIDVLFSDIVMPGGMNGVELSLEARRIRPGLKVLLTSGYANAPRDGGAPTDFQVLVKPYRPEELGQRLRRLLDGSPP